MSLFCAGAAECAELSDIPRVFHWIRLESAPFAQEELYALESWQNAHPKYAFKIWTHASLQTKRAALCPIDPAWRDEQTARDAILEREGGVWVHPDLICCKPLESLVREERGFVSSDGTSILACMPGLLHEPKKILPADFILPDQVFMTDISPSPLSGVCFWKFKSLPTLTRALYDIHGAKVKKTLEESAFMAQLKKVRRVCWQLVAFTLLNSLALGILCAKCGASYWKPVLKYALPLSLVFGLPWNLEKIWPKKIGEPLDFYELNETGRPTSLTADDQISLQMYSALFSHYIPGPHPPSIKPKIPHVLHFIWGGRSFPKQSIKNIESWIQLHPGWIVKFWTDDPSRPLPVPGMEKHLLSELDLEPLEPYFSQAANWAEKSDLLRCQILFNEGGVYVDHDIECFRSFESMNSQFSFYAPLEPFHRRAFDENSVIVTNCLIGSKPGHPILKETLDQIANRWDLYTHLFPCNDKSSVLLRTLGRTFDSFKIGVDLHIKEGSTLIFPSSWVFPLKNRTFAPHSEARPFANHQWANIWFRDCHDVTPDNFSERIAHWLSAFKNKLSLYLRFEIVFFISSILIFVFMKSRKKIRVQYAEKIPRRPSPCVPM